MASLEEMKLIEKAIYDEIGRLEESMPQELALKVMEMTQREVHHREFMLFLDRKEDLLQALTYKQG